MTEHAKAIWQIADQVRGTGHPSVRVLIRACTEAGIPFGVEELDFVITRMRRDVDQYISPEIANFIAQILNTYRPKSILDPWAGMGMLDVPIQSAIKPEQFDAYTVNHAHGELWPMIEGTAGIQLHTKEPLRALQEITKRYDAAVSCLPWNARFEEGEGLILGEFESSRRDTYDLLLILQACRRLKDSGVGVFVVANSFFSGRSSVQDEIGRLGFRVTDAIQLPEGSFRPVTHIQTHIIVLRKTDGKELFTGKYSPDADHQRALIDNMTARHNGAVPALGRIVPASEFHGFSPVELKEQISEQSRRMGLVPYGFSEVVLEINRPRQGSGFEQLEEKPNSVYLPQMARTPATISQERLPERLKHYYQLVLDPDKADAEFLANLLNTDFGQMWRDSLKSGGTIGSIPMLLLRESTIYLPPVKQRVIQNEVMECNRQIQKLDNELNELKAQLWKRPANFKKVRDALQKVNKEDRFEDWIDTLPFPLASILWVCHTQTDSLREQIDRKLHFCEALAQFLAVIYISACHSHKIWPEIHSKMAEALIKHNLSFEMATFGTWKAIVELLQADLRRVLNEDPELCFELFRTRNNDFLEALLAKNLITVLQETNAIRNNLAHGGAIRESEAASINKKLAQHIDSVREVFGVAWEDYLLLLPGQCSFRGGMFDYDARKVMGSRTPFPKEKVKLAEAMEDGHLHLWNPYESRALKLLPLIKVMPSPRTEDNACYFYSRQQRNGIRFLSYYFDADAEVVQPFSDVADILKSLSDHGLSDFSGED